MTVHEGGSIVITPMRQTISAADAARAARELIKRNAPAQSASTSGNHA